MQINDGHQTRMRTDDDTLHIRHHHGAPHGPRIGAQVGGPLRYSIETQRVHALLRRYWHPAESHVALLCRALANLPARHTHTASGACTRPESRAYRAGHGSQTRAGRRGRAVATG